MIIIFKYLIPKNYLGITIYPFIFLKKESLKEHIYLINHENIHLKQQKELLWFFFFIIYSFEYLIRLLQYKNHYKAYKSICFEKEAYKNEHNLNYLIERKKFSSFKYFS
jgi:hypothetical protein